MYKQILVPIALDHGDHGAKAISVARQLLDEGGHITLLHVMEQLPSYATSYLPEGALESNRNKAVAELNRLADAIGKTASSLVIAGHSHNAIIEYAEKNGVDCIVIASHKPGLEDYFLGSTAARVVRHAKCCVHVLR